MKWQLKPHTTTVYCSSRCRRKPQLQRKGSRYIERRLLSDPMAGPRFGGVCVKEALIKSRDARCGSGRALALNFASEVSLRRNELQHVVSGADGCKAPRCSQGRYLGKARNEADAAADATRSNGVSFAGPKLFCADKGTYCCELAGMQGTKVLRSRM